MKDITSRSNPLFKQWMHQKSVAGRVGQLIWLEGEHLCQAWLAHREAPLWAIFNAAKRGLPSIESILAQVPLDRQVVLGPDLFKALSTVSSPQGVMFLVQYDQAVGGASEGHSMSDLKSPQRNNQCVLLDAIQDPGNVGTILRLCAALGIERVVLGSGSAAAWSPKVLRSAQGAHFVMRIEEVDDLKAWIEQFQATSSIALPLITTALEGSRSLWQADLPKQALWVFGHEGQGVSPALIEMADITLRIEHDQRAVDSLNVASAAAICLFEQARQHHQ